MTTAIEHHDNLPPNPACPICGAPQELVMLERFTGWWCRGCATEVAAR